MSYRTTRRDFLKRTTAVGTGTAAGLLGVQMTAGRASADEAAETGEGQAKTYNYAVHTTDVLVVGSGIAGMSTAINAIEDGAQVTIIDKGKYAHSGATGMAWGHYPQTTEYCADKSGAPLAYSMALDTSGVCSQAQWMKIGEAVSAKPFLRFIEQSGCIINRNRYDGQTWGTSGDPEEMAQHDFIMMSGAFFRFMAQYLERVGIEIHDYMMMVDLLTSESGEAAGVVALDLRDGTAHVFRAKKVVLATGGYSWATGTSSNGPDSTGEGTALFLKRGLQMRDCEFNGIDLEAIGTYAQKLDGPDQDWIEPALGPSIAGSYYEVTYNNKGENFMRGFFEDPANQQGYAAMFNGLMLCCVREELRGGADEYGSLYMDISNIMGGNNPLSSYSYFDEWAANIQDGFGEDAIDLSNVRCVFNSFQTCGMPRTNDETCETEIPGVYYAGFNFTTFGSIVAWGLGTISGTNAAATAANASLLAYSEDDVQKALSGVYSWMEKDDVEDGIRPVTIQRKIQRAFATKLLYLKDEAGINEAIEEFNRIREEDLPKMQLGDKSRVMNRDWRNAIEVDSMLTMALASAYAALERRESRPTHFRTDYPTNNNDEYIKFMWVSMNEDGTFSVEPGEVDDSAFPIEELKPQMLNVDISIPNPPAAS